MAQNKTPFVAKVYGQIKLTEEDWNYEKFCNLTFGYSQTYSVMLANMRSLTRLAEESTPTFSKELIWKLEQK